MPTSSSTSETSASPESARDLYAALSSKVRLAYTPSLRLQLEDKVTATIVRYAMWEVGAPKAKGWRDGFPKEIARQFVSGLWHHGVVLRRPFRVDYLAAEAWYVSLRLMMEPT